MPDRRIDDEIREIARIVQPHGGRALLVGGCVRDRLAGAESKDFDIEVFGIDADRLIELLRVRHEVDLVGASFGILKIKGLPIDVSLPRRDSLIADGEEKNAHRAFSVMTDPGMTVEEAAARRDFTINAIAYDPLTSEYFDPFGGRLDLEKRILRHVSEEHFSEDPLRVLRGVQFVARFELEPAEETTELCRTISLNGLSGERVFEEWKKLLLQGVRISTGLEFLRKCDQLHNFPELQALIGCSQDQEWHPEGDVWIHTLHCLDFFAGNRIGDAYEDLVVGLGILCHDLGKPATTRLVEGRYRANGHASAGVHPTMTFLERMTNQQTLIDEIVPLVKYHLVPRELHKSSAGDGSIRRLSRKVGRIDRLVRVGLADTMGRPPKSDLAIEKPIHDWLIARAESLDVLDSAPPSLLLGRHLIALGVEPGPFVGEVIRACYEHQLDGAITTVEEAIAFAREFVDKHRGD